MNILILPDSNFKWIWKKLVKTLTAIPNFRIYLYSRTTSLIQYLNRKETNNTFHTFNKDFYKLVINNEIPMKVDWEKVKYIERKYNISLLYDVILTDRQLGKNFYISATKHHDSKISKKCSLDISLNLCIKSFEYWENIINKYKINLIISYGAGWGLHARPLFIIAKNRKITIRNLVSARIRSLFYWAADEYGEFNKKIKRDFDIEKKGNFRKKNIKNLKNILSSSSVEKETIKSRTFFGLLKKIIYYILMYFYRYYKNKEKFEQTQPLFEGLGYLLNGYINQKYINKIAEKKINSKDLSSSFFLPLQQVPESTTIGLSFMHDQLNFVLETALRLPPQYKLIVKEHLYSIEGRSRDFYNSIKKLPNVIFAHNFIPGEYLISNCIGVITLSSSAAYESAVLGKPTIIFEKTPHIKKLQHVLWCRDFNELKRLPAFLNKGIFKKGLEVSNINGQIHLQKCIKNFFSLEGDNLATTNKEMSDIDNEKVLTNLFSSLNIKYEKKISN
jgi:hypothetical protein